MCNEMNLCYLKEMENETCTLTLGYDVLLLAFLFVFDKFFATILAIRSTFLESFFIYGFAVTITTHIAISLFFVAFFNI